MKPDLRFYVFGTLIRFQGSGGLFGLCLLVRHHLIYIKLSFLDRPWDCILIDFIWTDSSVSFSFCTGYDLRLLMWSSSSQQAQACRWEMGSLKFAMGLSLLSYESCRHASFSTCQKPSADFCLSFLDLLRYFTAVSFQRYLRFFNFPNPLLFSTRFWFLDIEFCFFLLTCFRFLCFLFSFSFFKGDSNVLLWSWSWFSGVFQNSLWKTRSLKPTRRFVFVEEPFVLFRERNPVRNLTLSL